MDKRVEPVKRKELEEWTSFELAQALIEKEGAGFEHFEVEKLAQSDRSDLIKECTWAEINK